MEKLIALLKQMGFAWERNTIGVLFDSGRWNVNVVLLDKFEGTMVRKPAFGFLKFDTVEEAVDAKEALRTN